MHGVFQWEVCACVCEMQEVSVLASDCATMLIDIAAVPDDSYLLLSQLIAEATFPANLTALKMLHTRLDDFEVTSTRLTILVSCLLKVRSLVVAERYTSQDSAMLDC